MTDTPQGPSAFDAMLRPLVRTPAVWFGCALDLSVLLPSIGEEIDRDLGALVDRAEYEAVDPRRLFGLMRAFALLAGYAAENFLKGLWIARRKETTGREDAAEGVPAWPRGAARPEPDRLRGRRAAYEPATRRPGLP